MNRVFSELAVHYSSTSPFSLSSSSPGTILMASVNDFMAILLEGFLYGKICFNLYLC